ncbi:MAG: hypothetical protein HQM12_22915 [SAR324 cluster bacterium]|nr:hypothetical protein [SAR324 cluster bacterium]
MKTIKEKAKTYFFLSKNAQLDKKLEVFQQLYAETRREITPVLEVLQTLSPELKSLK